MLIRARGFYHSCHLGDFGGTSALGKVGFEYHGSNVPVILFTELGESTEYTVLTHIGVRV